MDINEVIKYIADYLKNMEHEVAICLKHMDRMRSGLTDDISGALSDAISDYAMDNDMDEDEVYEEIYSEYEDIDLFYQALDYIDNNVNEGYNTVNWRHFDNDKRRYDSYVLVSDSDGAIIYNYKVWTGDFWKDILDEAIKDANDLARKNRYGSYSVYGCEMHEYDENTLVYNTDNHVNEAFFNKWKRNPYRDIKNGEEYETQPLKEGIGLYDIRQRVEEIIKNCNETDVAIAKKQALRLYKMVDAMINQGKYVY